MNHFYRVIRDDSGRPVAVAEHVRCCSGRHGTRAARRAMAALGWLLGAAPALAAPDVGTLPTGGRVNAGSAQIVQRPGAPVLDIRQTSPRAVIDWGSFDVGAQATVNFQQPNAQAATLNRVQAGAPSQIFGRITAPGQVFILNPSGVLFGASAQVDVGGLVATTHRLSDADFMAGRIALERGGATGAVVNEGDIRTTIAGYAALLAPEVRNSGIIVARQGTVALAAGEAITLQFEGSSLVGLTVTPSAIAALVASRRAVQAPGGLIILAAEAAPGLAAGVVQVTGLLQATGAVAQAGRIVLQASDTVQLAGATLDVHHDAGPGGTVQATAPALSVQASRIDARGATGGGTVHLGGAWQGSGTLAHARTVDIDAASQVDASATVQGHGGEIVAWSALHDAQGRTAVYGALRADGAGAGGDGGRIETSGHALDVRGARVSAAAAGGAAGQWLLDPYNITVAGAGASGTPYAPSYTSAADSVVLASDIAATLNGGTSVTLTTGAGGASDGNIDVNASILKTAGGNAALTLQAHNDITLATGVAIASSSGQLAVTLNSDFDASGTGGIVLNTGASITSLGGNVRLGGGTAGDASGLARGGSTSGTRVGVLLDGASIDAGGGQIVMNGQGGSYAANTLTPNNIGVYIANGSTVSTSGSGTVQITGIGGTAASAYGFHHGVAVIDSTVSAGSSGTSTITGTGGQGDGVFSGSDQQNNGVHVDGATALITTAGGNLVLQGTGGGIGDSLANSGIAVSDSTVQTIGSGSLTLTGTGGSGANGASNFGVLIEQAAIVGTVDGALQVTGVAAPAGNGLGGSAGVTIGLDGQLRTTGTGTITVHGTGGSGSADYNPGIFVLDVTSRISTQNGDISLTGIGAATAGELQAGVYVAYGGIVHAGGTGRLTVHGTAGGTPGGELNNGVVIDGFGGVGNQGTLSSAGGAITVTGIGNSTAGILMAGSAANNGIFNQGNGPITLNADGMTWTAADTISAGTGTVTLRPVTAGTLIAIGGADVFGGSPSTLGLGAVELGRVSAGTLVIGRNDGSAAGTITVAGAAAAPGVQDITLLTGADIAVNANLSVLNRLTMTAGTGAAVGGSGVLSATSLLLNGTGVDYALAAGLGHQVGTLAAANADALAFRNAAALTIGSVGATDGIDASGPVAVATLTGDLTLAQDVQTTNTGTTAIVLNAGEATAAGTATGGNLIGAGGAVTTGTGGRATLMTGAVAGSTGLPALAGGAGSGRFRYGSDESTTAYSAALGTGSYAIYRQQPTLTVTANDDTRTYSGATYSGGNGVAVSGAVNGDTTPQLQLAFSYGGTSQGAVNASPPS